LAKKKKKHASTMPVLDKGGIAEILARQPNATKRDLTKLLGVKGSDRIKLKRTLKEMQAEGLIEGNRRQGYIQPGTLPEVAVLEITGTDIDGELVAQPQKWESNEPAPSIIVVPAADAVGPALGRGERVLARISKVGDGYEGLIIKRLGTSAHKVLGVLREGPHGLRIEPIDRKSRTEFAVEAKDRGGAAHNELVVAEPLPGRAAGFPRARVMEKLGNMSSPKTVSLIAIHAHGIPTEFPKEVLDEAERAAAPELRGRTDLRAVPLVTIDPEDARDHDDAVWAGPDDDPRNPGGHIALVAIADVAHYVVPGSALDREAYKRGNSAYFPDRVVPMLPEHLSAGLCSLKEGVDRACLAVRMVFDKNGQKKRQEFLRGVMRSAARLTYAQAQRAFDGAPDADMDGTTRATLAAVWDCYQTLTLERKQRDPLDLDLPERRVILGEDGKIKSIAYRERLESMKLIEEFMVLANVAAAEVLEQKKTPLIYRIHEQPSKEKLFGFTDFLRTVSINFAKGQVMKPGVFNRILSAAKGGPHEAVMNDVVLRTQAQAVYSPDNVGHFGLNLAKYAHFTSPIRRYADLIVHRALVKAHHFGEDGLTDREAGRLGEIAEHISMTERRAMAAERDSTDRYVAAFMEDRVGAMFDARITGVTRFGLFVRLAETGAEGLLPIRSLGGEYYRHDEAKHALIGERSNFAFRLGDKVKVKLVEAAPLTGGLRFELADTSTRQRSFKPTDPRPPAWKGKKKRKK
jgi:ribonuclease R